MNPYQFSKNIHIPGLFFIFWNKPNMLSTHRNIVKNQSFDHEVLTHSKDQGSRQWRYAPVFVFKRGFFFFIFDFSIKLTVTNVLDKSLPITGFKLWTSGVGSDRSTNWATTYAECTIVSLFFPVLLENWLIESADVTKQGYPTNFQLNRRCHSSRLQNSFSIVFLFLQRDGIHR